MKEKSKDLITSIIVLLITITGYFVFIYSIIYFIENRFDWYYILLLVLICSVVLFFFTRGSLDIIKYYKNKLNNK